MKVAKEFSFVDPDMILGQKTSVFREMNPEIPPNDTYFHRHLARLEGENHIVDIGTTPMDVITSHIYDTVDSAASRAIVGKKNPKEPSLIEMNHLSIPKGMERLCEVCCKYANYCCCDCLVTFYCSIDHRYMDGVHALICGRLRIIRNPKIYKTTEVDRRRIKGQRAYVMEKLVDDLVRQSFGFLYKCKFEEAMVTLHHSRKLLPGVYGEDNYFRQLVLIYAALTECYVGLDDLESAEQMLRTTLATLIIAKDKYGREKLNFSTASVNNAQGKLLYALGQFKEAVFFFSEYIYHITKVLGPYHVRACTGYFSLAKTFLQLGKTDNANHILYFCADLWLGFLDDTLHRMISGGSLADLTAPMVQEPDELVSFITEMEIRKNLHEVWEYVDEESQVKMSCQITLCEGILHFLHKEYRESRVCAMRCLKLSNRFNDKELVNKIKFLYKHAGRRDATRKSHSHLDRD